MTREAPWPAPPREPGPWAGSKPVAPPGNTALPPLPGPGPSGGAPGTGPADQWISFSTPNEGLRVSPELLPSSGVGMRPKRTAPSWLVPVGVVVILALAAGAAYYLTKSGPKYPDEWDRRVKPVADWVEGERKLEFEHPVEVEFLSSNEYAALARGDEPDDDETKQMWEDTAAQMRALGMLSGEVDLSKATDTLSDSGTLAFYDPKEKKIFVRGTKVTPALRVTLAHELTHVLQDQHFDLGRIQSLPENQAPVLRALAEGDADRIEKAYVDEVLSAAERKAYQKESGDAGDDAMDEIDAQVPPAMTAMFASPYVFGPVLLDYLERQGGHAEIDEALRNPPTEEVLFNPLLHGSKAAEPKGVGVKAPGGTEVIDGGEFGSTAWYLMLSSRLEPRAALAATDGIGGDAYTVYRSGEEVCVRVYAVGDDAKEQKELYGALKTWVSKSPKTATVTVDEGQIRFQSCDPGTGTEVAGADTVSVDLFGLPITRTQTYLEMMDGGSTDEQARCMADAVIDRFTLAQLSDTAFLQSATGQAAIRQLALGCR